MGKHAEKVHDALKRRQELTPKNTAGMFFRKPGSQNRKKGYKRDAAKKGS